MRKRGFQILHKLVIKIIKIFCRSRACIMKENVVLLQNSLNSADLSPATLPATGRNAGLQHCDSNAATENVQLCCVGRRPVLTGMHKAPQAGKRERHPALATRGRKVCPPQKAGRSPCGQLPSVPETGCLSRVLLSEAAVWEARRSLRCSCLRRDEQLSAFGRTRQTARRAAGDRTKPRTETKPSLLPYGKQRYTQYTY